jgi:hypothetical protein
VRSTFVGWRERLQQEWKDRTSGAGGFGWYRVGCVLNGQGKCASTILGWRVRLQQRWKERTSGAGGGCWVMQCVLYGLGYLLKYGIDQDSKGRLHSSALVCAVVPSGSSHIVLPLCVLTQITARWTGMPHLFMHMKRRRRGAGSRSSVRATGRTTGMGPLGGLHRTLESSSSR